MWLLKGLSMKILKFPTIPFQLLLVEVEYCMRMGTSYYYGDDSEVNLCSMEPMNGLHISTFYTV